MTDEAERANEQPQNPADNVGMAGRGSWSLMTSTTLEGKLGALIAWYFDGNFADVRADRAMVNRLLKCARWYLDGHIERLTLYDLLRLQDAVGSYPLPDADLDKVNSDLMIRLTKQAMISSAKPGPDLARALAEVSTPTLHKLAEVLQREVNRRTTA